MLDKKTVKLHLSEARNQPNREHNKVDLAMLEVLGEMALLDIAPDGTFSDAECSAWEVFRRIINKV